MYYGYILETLSWFREGAKNCFMKSWLAGADNTACRRFQVSSIWEKTKQKRYPDDDLSKRRSGFRWHHAERHFWCVIIMRRLKFVRFLLSESWKSSVSECCEVMAKWRIIKFTHIIFTEAIMWYCLLSKKKILQCIIGYVKILFFFKETLPVFE